jgi:hypothetical protein
MCWRTATARHPGRTAVDEEFFALVYADQQLVDADFDDIVRSTWVEDPRAARTRFPDRRPTLGEPPAAGTDGSAAPDRTDAPTRTARPGNAHPRANHPYRHHKRQVTRLVPHLSTPVRPAFTNQAGPSQSTSIAERLKREPAPRAAVPRTSGPGLARLTTAGCWERYVGEMLGGPPPRPAGVLASPRNAGQHPGCRIAAYLAFG